MEQRALIRSYDLETTIAACKAGDRQAFHTLFEAYKDRVYSIAFHFSGETDLAKDITQQVFLKLFTCINQFRHDAEFTTWLYRLVANACVDEQRKQKRFVPFTHGVEVQNLLAHGSQEETYAKRQVSASVQTAIAALSPKLRLPILLKYVEGLSYEEIAATLGCSIGTVSSRLNRGHKALAHKLEYLRESFQSGE
ncbi:MAG: sigma-70 family RNA polymerase sigma factor [Acidobacteria bacterium]|nr:sigma-70 family RNA polymerase sigma factor [Acidobacteriota bacterium]